MKRLYVGSENGLTVLTEESGRWSAKIHLRGFPVQCVAADPFKYGRVYCGTLGQGLWSSDDAGASWDKVGDGIRYSEVTSVAVSPTEHVDGFGVLWAGTDPSALFRSDDGGETWQEQSSFLELPSAPTWSFPPKPYTHHVRAITPDANQPGLLYVAIEAGAVLRSFDSGDTWEDRKPTGPFDAHFMVTHPLAPGRVYAACGDGLGRAGTGYAESHDAGATWQRFGEGLRHHYLWGVVVDSANPDNVIISAAHSPQHAHNPRAAASAIYWRSGQGPWQQAREGLPGEEGNMVYVLASDAEDRGSFYAASNSGVYRSADDGRRWERLAIEWPDGFQVGRVLDLEVASSI